VFSCPDIEVVDRAGFVEVRILAKRGPAAVWLRRGATYPGEASNHTLPTFVRPVTRSRPPLAAAGALTASPTALLRWEQAAWAQPPFHYEDVNIVEKSDGVFDGWIAEEEEVILGYPRAHTANVWKSGRTKNDPAGAERARKGALGAGWAPKVAAALLSFPCADRGYLASPVGVATIVGGAVVDLVRPLGAGVPRELLPEAYALHPELEECGKLVKRGFTEGQALVVQFLRSATLKGSDVRLASGELMAPHALPRQSARSELWRWRAVLSLDP